MKSKNREDILEELKGLEDMEGLEDIEDPEGSEGSPEGPETGEAGEADESGNVGEADEKDMEAEVEEEELNTKYLRLAADFQNFRRRVDKEKNDIYAYANEKIMTELLEVIDNFDRALAIETADTGMKEGMEMIFKQLTEVLEKSGLKEIPALEEEFDPSFHHAVQTISSKDHKGGQITTVLQKGYILNNKVIRPSMVIVAE